jgi:hypothetical protein
MSIYDQDINNNYKLISPPDKRAVTLLAWGRVMMKPLQWLHDLFFGGYAEGDSSPMYNAGTSYVVGNRVQYLHKVYEVWMNPPTSGIDPTNTDYWLLVLNDFRGAEQRIQFNSQIPIFEFLLNQWFQTTFVQPVYSPPSAHSDIWIESTTPNDGSFVMFPNDDGASFMLPSGQNEDFMVPDHSFINYDFIVHYPVAIINTADLLNQLTALVNKYKLAGTIPTYQSY